MTLGDQFYLKSYCTANGPGVYRKPAERTKDRARRRTGAVHAGVRGAGRPDRGFEAWVEDLRPIPR